MIKLHRDFFFEFAGMPKSGKTTIIESTAHYFKRQGLSVTVHSDSGTYAPIEKSSIGSLNIYLACKAVEFILISSEREKVNYRINILDRGIFDRCIFTNALHKMGKISEDEANAIYSFLSIKNLTEIIDEVFVFITDPLLSMKREYKNKIIQEPGNILNNQFLSVFRQSTLIEVEKMNLSFPSVTVIDTSQLDDKVQDTAKLVVDKMLEKIAQD